MQRYTNNAFLYLNYKSAESLSPPSFFMTPRGQSCFYYDLTVGTGIGSDPDPVKKSGCRKRPQPDP